MAAVLNTVIADFSVNTIFSETVLYSSLKPFKAKEFVENKINSKKVKFVTL